MAAVVGSVLGTSRVLGALDDPLTPCAACLAVSGLQAAVLILGDLPYSLDDRDLAVFLRSQSGVLPVYQYLPARLLVADTWHLTWDGCGVSDNLIVLERALDAV